MNRLKRRLQQLYGDNSKHSQYQNVPAFVRDSLGYQESLDESWRGDTARYAYLLQMLDLRPGQRIADVGANTGFFVLSLAHRYPECQFVAYEINPNHVEFMRLVVEAFELVNVSVQQTAVSLQQVRDLPVFDAMLHLNVLHHAGRDFDVGLVDGPEQVSSYAGAYLNAIARKGSRLVLQVGYNWGGDKSKPIVLAKDQVGMVVWLSELLAYSGWEIDAMAFAMRHESDGLVYSNLPDDLVSRPPSLLVTAQIAEALQPYDLGQFKGEFYRRPIAICRSTRLAPGQP